ncbi:unnamed protein product [Orchesella dallaii]|uniref:C2H2-type domain-containing protein n=1 Tax=Orchesella dallaii TaxID=48710 RepID=A0ABP1Q7A0_9HEXA
MDPSRKRKMITTPRIRSLQNRVSVMFARQMQAREREVSEKNKEISTFKQQIASTKEVIRAQASGFQAKEDNLRQQLLKASEANSELRKENVALSKSASDNREAVSGLHDENISLREENTRLKLELEETRRLKREVEAKIQVMEMELDESFNFDDENEDCDSGVAGEEQVDEIRSPIKMLEYFGRSLRESPTSPTIATSTTVTVNKEGAIIRVAENGYGNAGCTDQRMDVEDSTGRKNAEIAVNSVNSTNKMTPNSSHVVGDNDARKTSRRKAKKTHGEDIHAENAFSCTCGINLSSKQGLTKHIARHCTERKSDSQGSSDLSDILSKASLPVEKVSLEWR